MLTLLKEGLVDEKCERFIFATESCIPIVSLTAAGDMLFQSDLSWLNAFHGPKHRFEELECFRAVRSDMIPAKYVWKSFPGWITLTRKHAAEILDLPNRVDADLVSAWGKGPWREGWSYFNYGLFKFSDL